MCLENNFIRLLILCQELSAKLWSNFTKIPTFANQRLLLFTFGSFFFMEKQGACLNTRIFETRKPEYKQAA